MPMQRRCMRGAPGRSPAGAHSTCCVQLRAASCSSLLPVHTLLAVHALLMPLPACRNLAHEAEMERCFAGVRGALQLGDDVPRVVANLHVRRAGATGRAPGLAALGGSDAGVVYE